ncbi:MAG: cytochrome oxidase [Deltaproteobacteria bacterium]|nr:cytochrome oxidase [Myxococcales bacterium]MDP3220761.1 cytochrome oxidase [Deltaproteobacteria bacterium]
MEVVILLAFIGLLLTGGALVLFTRSLADRDWQHVDRMSLFPIQDDAPPESGDAHRNP